MRDFDRIVDRKYLLGDVGPEFVQNGPELVGNSPRCSKNTFGTLLPKIDLLKKENRNNHETSTYLKTVFWKTD